MRRVKELIKTLAFIWKHPLNQKQKMGALLRFFGWQWRSRFFFNAHRIPFCNGVFLWVRRGMAGATGNIYCGLHEFESMGFLLHFLRPSDLLVDVGANVGSYAILAASTGAKAIAFEPIPESFEALTKNVSGNRAEKLVVCRRMAVGGAAGEVLMTRDLDAMNHIVEASAEVGKRSVVVPMVRLDDVIQGAFQHILLKVDAEGYDGMVLKGAEELLSSGQVSAILIETVSDDDDEKLKACLFSRCVYDPFVRDLRSSTGRCGNNYLYIKEEQFETISARLKEAKPFRVLGQQI